MAKDEPTSRPPGEPLSPGEPQSPGEPLSPGEPQSPGEPELSTNTPRLRASSTLSQKLTALGTCVGASAGIVLATAGVLGPNEVREPQAEVRVPQVIEMPSEVGVGPVLEIIGNNLDLVLEVLFVKGGDTFRVPHLRPGLNRPSRLQIMVPDILSPGEYRLLFGTSGGTVRPNRTIVVNGTIPAPTPTSQPTPGPSP